MARVIDTSEVDGKIRDDFDKYRGVLLDTNIWILIEGFDYGAPRRKVDAYSAAYKELLVRNTSIFINEYIVGEFCNRCARLEYESLKKSDASILTKYKQFKRLPQFRMTLESIRDSALGILEDCEFIPTNGNHHYGIADVVEQFCNGILDFSDVVITEFCVKENLLLMSDDRDFWGKLDVITYRAPGYNASRNRRD